MNLSKWMSRRRHSFFRRSRRAASADVGKRAIKSVFFAEDAVKRRQRKLTCHISKCPRFVFAQFNFETEGEA